MTLKREFIDYINDIMDSIEKIETFTKNMEYNKFISDDKTNYAVVRCFEIIGEATKSIPKQIIKNNQHVPWQEMAGIRDKLIHGYFGVNLEVVWKTIKEDIPNLKPKITQIINDLNSDKNEIL